jgi:deazaflavin-dependent oxidoreductase (nitroreductase family)
MIRTFFNQITDLHVLAYRVSRGVVGSRLPGLPPMLLLDHVGAKSGKHRTNPLAYVEDGEKIVIVASKGGAPRNPAWLHNLRAYPDTTVQVGSAPASGASARRYGSGALAAMAESRRRVRRLRELPAAHRAGDPARDPRTAQLTPASDHSDVGSLLPWSSGRRRRTDNVRRVGLRTAAAGGGC